MFLKYLKKVSNSKDINVVKRVGQWLDIDYNNPSYNDIKTVRKYRKIFGPIDDRQLTTHYKEWLKLKRG